MEYKDYCSSAIARNIEPQCDNLIVPGLEQVGVIVNLADVNPVKNGNLITDIGMKDGKTGYYIYQMGAESFGGTNTKLVIGKVFNTFDHTVSFVILDNSPTVCEQIIDQLSNGHFAMILENKHKRTQIGVDDQGKPIYNQSNRYQCYGFESGLKSADIECDKYSDDTNSGWIITLKESKATKSGWFFYAGSDEATEAAFKAIASPTEWATQATQG